MKDNRHSIDLVSAGIKQSSERDYWLNKLSGEITKVYFPYDNNEIISEKDNSIHYDRLEFTFSDEAYAKLMKLRNGSDSLLHMIFAAGLTGLLWRYTQQRDIIIGSTIMKQNVEGEFINTVLALRNKIEENMTFKELLLEVRNTIVDATKNQNYPIEGLLHYLNIPYRGKEFPLFDIAILLENIHDRGYIDHIVPNMIISLRRNEESITGIVEYNSKRYKERTLQKIIEHYKRLIETSIGNVNLGLSEIEIMSDEEKNSILNGFNETTKNYPKEQLIYQLFEEQARMHPYEIAIEDEDREMTYKELNERSNQLARILRKKRVSPDSIVAIMAELSIDTIVGIIGIVKAGGAFLPIDSNYPKDRINFMLGDSDAEILLSHSHLKNIEFEGEVINLDTEKILDEDNSNLDIINSSDDLAYMIYTSGSTGTPKGVMIRHQGLINYAWWAAKTYVRGEKIKFPLYTSISFDLTITSIFTPLITGNKIIVYRADGNEILIEKVIRDNRVNIVKATPSHLKVIKNNTYENSSIKRFIVGGEDLSSSLAKSIYKGFNENVEIYNEYGPTEAVVGCVVHKYDIEEDTDKSVPIGKPIDNTKIYILSKNNCLQPIGVVGELCIAGDGLARGYFKREKLTEERFINNPLSKEEKIYKTGDLARWLTDGTIEFLGRIDNQVKIRGFRIEIGEIEKHLLEIDDVKEAVVVAREDKTKELYICAYIVSQSDFLASEIREMLSKRLPDYMIPSYFVKIDSIPLTTNGKLDIKALPIPNERNTAGAKYVEPRNETERRLVDIWREVLGGEGKIGIDDSFFEIGGHSLKATTLLGKIHKEFNIKVSFVKIFENPTIRGLAEYIDDGQETAHSPIEPAKKREFYPLSPPQKRMYVLNEMDKKNTSYNIPTIVQMEGKVDVERLRDVFNIILDRHEPLRTSFHMIKGQAVQRVEESIEFKLEYKEIQLNDDINHVIKEWIRPFDLSIAPQFRAAIIKLEDFKYLLVMDMHHIISDGVSAGILIEEFARLYRGESLEELKLQYKDYVIWQQQNNIDSMKRQETYWLDRLKGELPVLNVPTDFERPSIRSFEGDSISFKLSGETYDNLKGLAKKYDATLYMVLLTAYKILLHKYTGQEDIIVGTPIAGRHHSDLQNIVGMFVNTLVMRNYPTDIKTCEEFLIEVKENALNAYENQDYQFDELVDKLDLNRDTSRNPLVETMFILQNIDTIDVEIDGLKITSYGHQNPTSKFDIGLIATELENGMGFKIEYSTSLFRKDTIERLGQHYLNILEEIPLNIQRAIKEIDVVSQREKHNILIDFNNTKEELSNKAIHELFEEQVEKTPENMALTYNECQLSYRELNKKANSLARCLKNSGVENETIVGIMTESPINTVVSMLAILKAGGAYLPIDSKYPAQRIEHMLRDSKVGIVLSDNTSIDRIKDAGFNFKILDLMDQRIYDYESDNLKIDLSGTNLAYVIYTSGSTGKPNGVMVEHRGITNFIEWKINAYNYSHSDTALQLMSMSFDAFGGNLYAALLSGGNVVLIDRDRYLDYPYIRRIIRDRGVTNFCTVPSMYRLLLEGADSDDLRTLRFVVLGGEKIDRHLIKNSKELKEDLQLINEYGPTEDSITATSNIDMTLEDISVIGSPIANNYIYILDKSTKPVPIGIPGEIYISGLGLARGYINNSKLTKERFIQNPFFKGQRMYKTGDVARWLQDGKIEYLGRIDEQVKIRGYRIELGDIENQLLKIDDVKEAVAIARKDDKGNNYLCAYYTSDKNISISQFKGFLTKELPDYMIPSYFVKIDKLPLTPNGKVDKRALPKHLGNIETGVKYEAPSNEIEKLLVEIYRDILAIDQIGINDDFFDLGGDSLKVVSLAADISKKLNIEVPVSQIFKNPTIKGISKYMVLQCTGSNDEYYILFNEGQSKNVFCFPPALGFGLGYMELAKLLNDYSIYAFNFIPRKDNLKKYADLINRIQPHEPLVLLGHSAGGNLAFEVAKELEKRGSRVSDIIILDSTYKREKEEVTEELEEQFDKSMFERNKKLLLFKDRIVEISRNYAHYHGELINSGIIAANIHFITSVETEVVDPAAEWRNSTSSIYKVYEGDGIHKDMLKDEALLKNGRIINYILEKIFDCEKCDIYIESEKTS
ncbi:amino acid adenylation domain-containing protein [Wukongibacter sp. M2B1]|uniref:amino acid adenylation domain-containing protein n=1 Tax=Wukongibacter sp. M2B1 TaxID=3088895 RepID=UPI003D7AC13C